MAFRIHESVVRGEIDNRVKGIVRGTIWLEGLAAPIGLELVGNAHPDLAGCRMTFVNPHKPVTHPQLSLLHPQQQGTAGDMTASRKVRVFDVPLRQALEMIDHQEKPPEHMANCLYLEWFSEANGRVVIESHDYELEISPPEWRMTAEEDAQRSRDSAAGMQIFLVRLTAAIEAQQRGQKDPEAPWDEHDYERFLKECDARTTKYGELLDKYGPSEEADTIIAKEMGWDRQENAAAVPFSVEEMNHICEEALDAPEPEPDPHREGIDWIRTKDGDLRHPLQYRCFESAHRVWQQAKDLGLERMADDHLDEFVFEFYTTAVKLAGALNSIARGEPMPEDAFTVAYLKRALEHLHKSLAGLEAVTPKQLLPAEMIEEARGELFGIRQSLLSLMDELRGRR